MIKKQFISKDKINIKVVLNKNSDKNFFINIFDFASNFLNIEYLFVSTEEALSNNFYNHLEKTTDFYFVDFIKEYEYIFAWNFYSKMHDLNNDFKLVLFKKNIEPKDMDYFKNGADDIIYTNDKYYGTNKDFLNWKIFSILRRKWDRSHKTTILIRNGVIIDVVQRSVKINTEEINITKKEFDVLYILFNEFNSNNSFISKNKIYKLLYKRENKENSRTIDQLIFRLKNKFPDNFFLFDKRKGIKIN